MSNPYRKLPDHQFWRTAVAGVERFRLDPVVETRFGIAADDRVATAGSCFAQHISRRLAQIGFGYQVVEDGAGLPESERTRRNFGVFSARYGNIYTSRQLLQLFQAAFEGRATAEPAWRRKDGRFVDALRPAIEPDGHGSVEDVLEDRAAHLGHVRTLFETCDVFVFTLGLTEAWLSREDGTAFPVAPGVSGGTFDAARHAFHNLDVNEVVADMQGFLAGLRHVNPRVRVVLTVSPVPLVATYEHRHALVATTYSKSVLRVAADMLYRTHDFVEYFPSYEIITGNYSDSAYFEADYRSVNPLGVDHAMRCFLRHFAEGQDDTAERVPHRAAAAVAATAAQAVIPDAEPQDLVCDEEAIEQVRAGG